jgi:AcrR family transcriptional regulator
LYEKFVSLGQEKQDAILNAALYEFADKGFDLASTNEITGSAGISKGALFHYFGSKEDLFFYLVDVATGIVIREYYEKIEPCDGDLLRRYQSAAALKARLMLRYPQMFDFLARLAKEHSPKVAEQLKEKLQAVVQKGYLPLHRDINEALFRPDVPAEKVKEIMIWALEGYGMQLAEHYKATLPAKEEAKRIAEELDEYIAILRRCFYRQEG